ncbi:sulfatase-like hydrolase/transferase, partial [uncultured Akkermansia sp.]|uniref:sulfatase-like hydrolase/transferase n=1 Tax=uncultured Akkermansia sp. TaxID=512294 RepID=UPI00265CE89E
MKLLTLLTVLLTAAVPSMAAVDNAVKTSAKTEKAARPNVIFILVDDMGWGDLDSNWSQQKLNGRVVDRKNEFKTPALSALAREGIQLRRHYSAAPVCAPARASLLLGVHQGTSRVVRNNRFDYPIEDSHTLGTVMQGAGYDTAAIGKWGVGGGGQSNGPVTGGPHQRGFNYFYGILDHLAGHFHYPSESRDIFEYNGYASRPEWKNIKNQVPQTAYSTDLFAARAKQWIVDQRKSARKTGKPFFLYLAFPAPHGNLVVPGAPYPSGGGLKGGLQWVKKNGTESVNTAFDARAEKDKDTYIYPDNARFPNDVAKRHSTMIRRVDDAVADLIHLLKDLKIDNNTMIVFTSDNGPHNEGGADPKHRHGAQNPQFFKSYGMMDGIKRDCWEGGMRVPTLVRWPARIPKGQISLQPGQFHDWLATLADVAGVPVPARSDGVSLLPT